LGGGISKKFDRYKDRFTIDTPIEVAHFGNNAGIIGAAMFAYRSINGQ
jgi:polyphosphate glucokinase